MHRLTMAAVAAALLLAPPGAGAQTPPAAPLPYGMAIGVDAATKAVAAAAAEAKKNGWFMAIAVVDSGSRLVAFSRMDNTQLGSIDIALGKAVTANNLRRPTKARVPVHGGPTTPIPPAVVPGRSGTFSCVREGRSAVDWVGEPGGGPGRGVHAQSLFPGSPQCHGGLDLDGQPEWAKGLSQTVGARRLRKMSCLLQQSLSTFPDGSRAGEGLVARLGEGDRHAARGEHYRTLVEFEVDQAALPRETP